MYLGCSVYNCGRPILCCNEALSKGFARQGRGTGGEERLNNVSEQRASASLPDSVPIESEEERAAREADEVAALEAVGDYEADPNVMLEDVPQDKNLKVSCACVDDDPFIVLTETKFSICVGVCVCVCVFACARRRYVFVRICICIF